MRGQYAFAPNGNIRPCPWLEDCLNYPAGCSGESYWCKRFETEQDIKLMRKIKGVFYEQDISGDAGTD